MHGAGAGAEVIPLWHCGFRVWGEKCTVQARPMLLPQGPCRNFQEGKVVLAPSSDAWSLNSTQNGRIARDDLPVGDFCVSVTLGHY